MTDDISDPGDETPPGAAVAPETETGGPPAPGSAFGRRPDIAGGVTVLSHNFRAPIVPESAQDEALPDPGAAAPTQVESGPAESPGEPQPAPDPGGIEAPLEDAPAVSEAAETGQSPVAEAAPSLDAAVPQPDAPVVEDVPPAGPTEYRSSDGTLGSAAQGLAEQSGASAPDAELTSGAPPVDTRAESIGAEFTAAPDPPDAPDYSAIVDDGAIEVESAAVDDGADDQDPGLAAAFDDPEGQAEVEEAAGSLLAVPLRAGPESPAEGPGEPGGEAAGEATRKREIRFDGNDEPLVLTDEVPAEPDEAESPDGEDGAQSIDETELARKLGINFRDGEAGTADPSLGPTREEAELARKLGIRFREDGGDDLAGSVDDELSEAARQLGIAFRDGDDRSARNTKKASLTARLILLITLFSGLAGLLFLIIFGESLMSAFMG